MAEAAAEVQRLTKLAAQAEAELAAAKAPLQTLDAENKQYEILLADAQRRLELDEKLAPRNAVTISEVDDRRTEVRGMEAKIAWTQQRKYEAEQRIVVVASRRSAARAPPLPPPKRASGPPRRASKSSKASATSPSSARRSTAW